MHVLYIGQLVELETISIKRFEERYPRNVERRRVRVISLSFVALLIASYVYTFESVREEIFLDDINILQLTAEKKVMEDD
jgi:hypothetical protein